MKVLGYEVTALMQGKCIHHCTVLGTFTASDLQQYLEDQDTKGLSAAAKTPQPRWRVTATEVANRVADRLIQKWRKAGLIAQSKRGTWTISRG